jgi:hypothetical protein
LTWRLAVPDQENDEPDQDVVGGRIVIEVTDWDANLFVGAPLPTMPRSSLFDRRMLYTNGIEVQGRIVSPSAHRWKTVRVWISALLESREYAEADTEEEILKWVGHLGPTGSPDRTADFTASLDVPRDALPTMVTALGSVWKVLQLGVSGDPLNGASVEWFSFSRAIPPKLVRDDFADD